MKNAPRSERAVARPRETFQETRVPDPLRDLRVQMKAAEMERLGLVGGTPKPAPRRRVASDARPEPWPDLDSAARELGVSTQTIWKRIKDGQPLKGHRLRYAD